MSRPAKKPSAPLQLALFQPTVASFDDAYASVRRIALDETSWLDHAEGWVRGADALFEQVRASRAWSQRRRWMYDRMVDEPRLTAPWSVASGRPLQPSLVDAMRLSLSARYGVTFDSVGFNFYRDGNDGVAWHRDHIRRDVAEPVIVLVSLGERRKFRLRRRGRETRTFLLGRGDLLVAGGRTNRDWEHSVPKTRAAQPRISLAFRHGLDSREYGGAGR